MQSKSAALQEEINSLDLAIQQGASDAQLNLWEMQRDELKKQLTAALEEEAQKENTALQVGYSIDNVTFEGLTIAEIITDDTQFKLIRNGFQELMVQQTEAHNKNIEGLQDELTTTKNKLVTAEWKQEQAEQANEQLRKDSNDLEVKNYELVLVNDELNEKVRKVAELQHESNQQIEQQKSHIDELQKQLALGIRGALNVVDIPQDTSKMAAEIIARKVRITNVRFKDENGIDLRLKLAEVVLTGEPIEYEAIYEKRYIIQNSTEAEQYRADEANKKAEQEALQAAIPTLEVPEIAPVNAVLEEEATTGEQTFPENHQVDANANGENTETIGDGHTDEVVGQNESEVITLESLQAQVNAIKAHVGLAA